MKVIQFFLFLALAGAGVNAVAAERKLNAVAREMDKKILALLTE